MPCHVDGNVIKEDSQGYEIHHDLLYRMFLYRATPVLGFEPGLPARPTDRFFVAVEHLLLGEEVETGL